MRAIDIACRECAQQPGELCFELADGQFHAKRVEDALAWDTFTQGAVGEVVPPKEEFDKAVIDILL